MTCNNTHKMASLAEQMQNLQKQQTILAEKIKQEEEFKRKQLLNLDIFFSN